MKTLAIYYENQILTLGSLYASAQTFVVKRTRNITHAEQYLPSEYRDKLHSYFGFVFCPTRLNPKEHKLKLLFFYQIIFYLSLGFVIYTTTDRFSNENRRFQKHNIDRFVHHMTHFFIILM